ncbi:MAG: hypothetical protein J1F02_04475 [Lachnospiraceae bacterium]|nr:hypothetical protein [Lachnospiraceae bacterium]
MIKVMQRVIIFVLIPVFSFWFLNQESKAFVYRRANPSCSKCAETIKYDTSYSKDEMGYYRQYGIKFCTTHKNAISSAAVFYKRGYTDYNCLAYALKKNFVNSWDWPQEWGNKASLTDVKAYLSKNGYTYFFEPSNYLRASGDIIYIYGTDSSNVLHFARHTTLGGNALSGVAIISKWGAGSLYTNTNYSPFTSAYGSLLGVCSTSYVHSTK